MKKIFLIALASVFFASSNLFAQAVPVLDFFHGRECPHCHKEKAWFPTLKKAYPDLVINEYEVWHEPANAILAEARLKELGQKFTGVPANIIGGEKVVVGFQPEAIIQALSEIYGEPAVSAEELETKEEPSWIMRLLETILSWFGV